jgi:hypothetical protein
MKKIKILIIGNPNWITLFKLKILDNLPSDYHLESISNIIDAKNRLNHNSYDILIIQNSFSKEHTICLAKFAYAMTRPSLIIYNSLLSLLKAKICRLFSKFFNKFKLTHKLIHFETLDNIKLINNKIEYLANNHLQYFDDVNNEFEKNFKI